MLNTNLHSIYLIAGDFNQAKLRTVLPHYYQHLDFAPNRFPTPDQVYTIIKQATENSDYLSYATFSIHAVANWKQVIFEADQDLAKDFQHSRVVLYVLIKICLERLPLSTNTSI